MAIDETLITHKNGNQVWLVGAIDITTKNIRLDVLPERNHSNLKMFVTNHIILRSNITHDGWRVTISWMMIIHCGHMEPIITVKVILGGVHTQPTI